MILYVVITHRSPEEVRAYLEDLASVLPNRRVAVCYGGTRENFDELDVSGDKLFIEDPTLRRRLGQSYTSMLMDLHDRLVSPDPALRYVHLIEWDHIILDPTYEAELLEAMSDHRVGLLARNCIDHTGVNWPHSIDLLDDRELRQLLQTISVRDQDDPSIWGGLGDGMTISRSALQDFCRQAGGLARYNEAYIPTAVYHLGYRVIDAPPTTTLFSHLRFAPDYEEEEAVQLARHGALALHPVKNPAVRHALVAARQAAAS